jgi:mono/diheme cytochrome c family protein
LVRLRLSTATFAVVIAALAASLFLFASSGRSQIPASKEASDSAAKPSESAPTFYRDVLPILQQHCQRCHRQDEIAPFPLVTYEQARDKAAKIARVTSAKQMPPWFADPRFGRFSDDPSLTPQQIETLSAWARSGAPAGDPHDAPPPRKWAKGWVIRHPDTIVRMPAPVAIPARGDVEYTYEIVPTGFKRGEWVQMSEIRPSSRANVHHAVVYVRPPNSKWLRHAPIGVPFTASSLKDTQARRDARWTNASILLVYAPGSSPDEWPDGLAKFIPAGSELVFQMHYVTRGHPTTDQTSVGLVFAKQPPKQRVLTLQLTDDWFVIPPGDPDYRTEVHGTVPNDATLLSFFPHMHLRGKAFEYNIIRPGQPPETLLRVNYNFYWQLSYRLAKPLPLKAGTMLQAAAWFDNSRNNPHNPDPTVAVRWGDQTYDEMMVGFFDVAVPANVNKWQFFRRAKPAGK